MTLSVIVGQDAPIVFDALSDRLLIELIRTIVAAQGRLKAILQDGAVNAVELNELAGLGEA